MKMNPRKVSKLTTMLVVLVLLSVLGWSSAFGQTINDPAQGEKYGVWKVMNPQYPGIQTRAKCDTDVELNGRMTSSWEYQVRSTYKGTVDYVYLVGFGSPITHLNEMTGPFLATAKPSDVTGGSTELYGICGEHSTIKTGLHITIKCAVPTGQDAPCFKDSNGDPYERRDPSDASGSKPPEDSTAAVEHSGPATIKPGQSRGYWACLNRNSTAALYLTNLFIGSHGSIVDDGTTSTEYERQFKAWLHKHHPDLTLDPTLINCTFMGDTSQQAEQLFKQNGDNYRNQGLNLMPVDWSPQ